MSKEFPLIRSFPGFIAASLTVIYSAGAGVVPKGNNRQRKASLYSIAMQATKVVSFAWIWR